MFDDLARLPGTKDVFGQHNPIREMPTWLSGDAAGELLRFFQKIDANTGLLVHDFTSGQPPAVSSQQADSCSLRADGLFDDTRFLGDLYQDLSEAARKKYALLQTPEFVEEFILDRTLEPALDEFGLDGSGQRSAVGGHQDKRADSGTLKADGFRMIDPACGSGHFLLGAFRRILGRWQKKQPAANVRALVQLTLHSIHGVDVNPYAVAIARFRLLLVAMKACGVTRLADAPAFHFNVACGDSLLHGEGAPGSFGWHDMDHAYQTEDRAELVRILKPGHYHAVVANPPYITPKDKALNDACRERYSTCHRQYSLAVPFMQRLFQLARSGYGRDPNEAGFVGQITANSFMKREFGKKLIEGYFAGRDGTPGVDLTHVIDTSGAYIPGHGTPTVILFGRNRPPVAKTIRAVMGIRGEPATPDDPARGVVWTAILAQIDHPGSQSDFVSAVDSLRELFHKHPWSIGGGGAAELKEQLEETSDCHLCEVTDLIGFMVITGEDNCLLVPEGTARRGRVGGYRSLGDGDDVRDWCCESELVVLWPNTETGARRPCEEIVDHLGYLWPYRTSLKERKAFGIPVEEKGIPWWALREVYSDKLRTPLSIVFAFVATHNHFVLDRGGKVFKQSAPVIKLPPEATEDDHLGLLGLLNSSTGCFWMKQVFHDKGSTVDSKGARQTTIAFENFREFTGTGLLKYPLPESRPLSRVQALDALAQQLAALSPAALLTASLGVSGPLRSSLAAAHTQWRTSRQQMIALQEELDWECYRLYALIEEDLRYHTEPPPIALGQRAFEIAMARKMAAGELQTTWFERHGSVPITDLATEWPDDYKRLVERRIELIETDRNIGLIEQPEYKRRWNTEPWESQLDRALREWLLDRAESYFDFDGRMLKNEPQSRGDSEKAKHPLYGRLGDSTSLRLVSVAQVADVARQDPEFMQVGEVYRDDPAFDVERLVAELVEAESVPLLPVLRYKPSGLRKRAEWEQTWELQREEDRLNEPQRRGDAERSSDNISLRASAPQRLDIPVPPKYTSADFLKSDYWRLRGKLDVPKERWVSFPHCEGPDGTLVIAWAGYDHLQLARSISAYYVDIQERLGGRDDPRLVPLLACLLELLPWVKQWHNAPDAAFDGMCMGDYFEGFINEEARSLPRPGGGSGWTLEEIRAWQPPQRQKKKAR